MKPETANRIAATGRRLLTARLLKPTDYAVLDTLLWRVRRPGAWVCDPDYATIARLAGCCRDRAIKAVATLVRLGVLTKQKRHALVRWGRNRAQVAARQLSNAYTFCAPIIESSSRAANLGLIDSKPVSTRLEAALGRLGVAVYKGSGGGSGISCHHVGSQYSPSSS